MSTQHLISKDSLAKSVGTTSNSLWNLFSKNNLASFTLSRERSWSSLCSIQTTVCTAIVSVLSQNDKRNPMQQTIKNCLFAIPTTNALGAVGIHSLGTNYTVVNVGASPRYVQFYRAPKFGKV